MSETPGHKIIRPPFSSGQPPQAPMMPGPGGPPQIPPMPGPGGPTQVPTMPGPGGPGGGENRQLADMETRKGPAFPQGSSPENRTLADRETQQAPVLRPGAPPTQDRNLFVANAMSHYAVAQNTVASNNFPGSPGPMRPPNNFLGSPGSMRPPNNFPGSPGPMWPPSNVSTSKKKRRAPLTKRQKIRRLIIIGSLLLPSILIVIEAINLFLIYRQLEDGLSHIQALENTFHGSPGGGVEKYLNADALSQAQQDIDAAHADFAALSQKLDHDGLVSLAAAIVPNQINTVRALGHIADTGTAIAQQLLQTGRDIAPTVASALKASLASSTSLEPYLTPSSYQELNNTIGAILPQVHTLIQYTQGLSLNSLPISSKQKSLLSSILPLLPTLDTILPEVYQARDALGWFLGVDGQRNFLIEPMDRAELRATGGFTGQFGDLVLNGAHMGPLKLSNIGTYEEDLRFEGSPLNTTVYPKVVGQTPPMPYSEWWPVANWGLRDANLSADFPTSAKLAMDRYSYEFGINTDGVIMFSPVLIEHVLHVTGPISIPAYHQTITENNLESLLHYYQLDNAGILQEEQVENQPDTQIARKLFTQRVTTTLISTVSHLPIDKMFAIVGEIFQSMQSRDLQIYVSNSQLESLIGQYGSTASMDRSTTHDGFFVVQSNVSASKASQYVATSLQDNITLDAQGGATHNLQITLDYQQKGSVYGLDTYRDYMRIYVPTNSQLISGNGFDQYDRPYCGDGQQSTYRLCQADVYGDGSLVCTPPISIGLATSYVDGVDPYALTDHPLDVTGPPTNLQSDEPGRAMFAGWIIIPKNCTMKVTLSWYVPSMSNPYSLMVQSQSGVDSPLDVTVQPSSGPCAQSQGNALHFSQGMVGKDIFLAVKQQGGQCALVSS